ncbi:helix-turn-helix domain-containing protein [Micromonospora soli]|uniref:TetR/AcrR family transcriptional regulator n=1 Tax=Micromonospora sp. NBRC 110009 TaxID=3061627 RepID=UPI002672E85F|nr:TetR/AcrR family transcriptional regulator [Micromonospora sp. NBRC 110009]WKT98465.1 helix-turn-helix domain-containing protein [Micromonospora sp. NBRC 110009]
MARMAPEMHNEILAAATRRFAFAGYKGTSLRDIARDVGCSKAAVLYHFPNKEALLFELMAPALAAIRALEDRIAAAADPASAQRIAMGGFVDLAVQFRREMALLRGEFRELLESPEFAHLERFADRLVDAVAGHPERPAARIAARVMLAGIAETSGDFDDVPDDELRETLLALLRGALEPAD